MLQAAPIPFVFLWSSIAQAERHAAFVICNSTYLNVSKLPNLKKDAEAIIDHFRKSGFDVVDGKADLGLMLCTATCPARPTNRPLSPTPHAIGRQLSRHQDTRRRDRRRGARLRVQTHLAPDILQQTIAPWGSLGGTHAIAFFRPINVKVELAPGTGVAGVIVGTHRGPDALFHLLRWHRNLRLRPTAPRSGRGQRRVLVRASGQMAKTRRMIWSLITLRSRGCVT